MTRTVLVTGGGTGIGRAVAAAFAQSGDTVFITGRRTGPLEQTASELGSNVHAVTCDNSDPKYLKRLQDTLPANLAVVVHCAGGNTDFDREAPSDLDTLAAGWRANLDSNLLSAVLTTAAVRDRLTPGGRVITIGSIAADKGAGAYGAAKAAVATWNIDLAAELGPLGITANIVSPGYIADTEFFRDVLTDARREALIEATSTKRAGTPEDVAAAVLFLASAGAGQITGQVIAVNGGERTSR
ncbi:SDR family NAD(P)-dependent oxidoreductase [Rhodococcus sp. AD45-ID]|uniref:SDR family NAD(P)-dependent oxidoreductase n=1 Tax=unclassified Rhodococcus (in: high G+C Gram-positive bacteria) TaxID=192944 RepID=UPI0005D35530|nr:MULTISPECIES: SDR family oxidoreductase [unclassified Rhodococcus (in: high G+C Gram-positive bacteria)]KJF24237.1 3-oxoacyl-(acyl-carrier-protein) reductase FabG [Rhodococcus sp. AD45]NRI68250.1 SDR family oxidoreductase [Rhodococcus sp. MS16]PSR42555.1 SDR family NAD(P)-dependent oxidoreductase [Rhodococcus sp. AD45-ID]